MSPDKITTKKKGSQGYANRKKTLMLLTMVLPGAIWLIGLRYLPLAGITIAFKKYKVFSQNPSLWNNIANSEWVGLKNFEFLLSTDSANMIKNTLVYNTIFIVLGLIVSVTFAIMLNEITKKFVAKAYQTLMFFPYFLSWVVASYFLQAFLDPTNGLLTVMLKDMGLGNVNLYNTPGPWPYILVIANLWKNVGYTTILYLAAITGIDATQYEAAAIDGATKMQQIRFVTLPNIKTMIIILFIMNVGKIFNSDFGLFWNIPMNSGPLISVSQTIDTYVYRAMTATQNLGMSTAAGLLQNVIGFVCLMTANTIVRKVEPESSLF